MGIGYISWLSFSLFCVEERGDRATGRNVISFTGAAQRAGEGFREMDLDKFFAKKRATLVDRWFRAAAESYPPESASLIIRETNEFANPVGNSLQHGLNGIFDELLQEMDEERLTKYLDRIIRIRAIQGFTPAQALAFMFTLKDIVREELRKEDEQGLMPHEALAAFDTRIDQVALLAFNIYSLCREKVFEVKVEEIKTRSFRLLQRANLLAELTEEKP